MKILKSSIILAIAFITMLLNGCEDNEADAPNINPETGTLSGAITFVGTWPDSGSVLLTLDVQFPPMGPPAGSRLLRVINSKIMFMNILWTIFLLVNMQH